MQKEGLETLSEAINRLNKSGYTDTFRAQKGLLLAVNYKKSFSPEFLSVDEVVRFEGNTDLSDEAVIFALRDQKTGVKGTYTVAYSTDMDPQDMDVVQRLQWL